MQSAMEEIYDDLHKHASILRYLSASDRGSLERFVLGLSLLCKFTSSSTGKCNDCVSLLSLRDSATKFHSNTSQNEIDTAIKVIQSGKLLSSSQAYNLVEKAVNHGIKSAVGDNPRYAAFFLDAFFGKDIPFFKDVLVRMTYIKDPRRYKGKCGEAICSRWYIEKFEQRIFKQTMSNHYSQSSGQSGYLRELEKAFASIESQLEDDLTQGMRNKDYIKDQSAKSLKSAIKDLQRCGVKGYTLEKKVDALAWFVGGDANKIKKLQRA